jgi:hypothetical protein
MILSNSKILQIKRKILKISSEERDRRRYKSIFLEKKVKGKNAL